MGDSDKTQDQQSDNHAQEKSSSSDGGVSWSRISDLAVGAFVGSLVTIVISPLTQSVSFYLSQYLSKPVMSIEYVELIPAAPVVSVDTTKLTRIVRSPIYMGYASQHPDMQAAVGTALEGKLSIENAKDLARILHRLGADLHQDLVRFESVETRVSSETEPSAIRSIISNFEGPMLSLMPFADDPPDEMKKSFVRKIHEQSEATANLIQLTAGIEELISKSNPGTASVWLKLSVLNRGETDGLLRNVGKLDFLDQNRSLEIRRIAPPVSADNSIAVRVKVTNAPDTEVREHSVGRVEKHTMVELWYETKRAPQADTPPPLTQSSRFRIILADQENHKIRYTFSPPQALLSDDARK